jgi:glutathione peroxidase-family protein
LQSIWQARAWICSGDQRFCQKVIKNNVTNLTLFRYNFTGRLFSKCDVNGDDAHPVFQWLKAQDGGSGTLTDNIKWNFTKFLLDKQGNVVNRWGTVTPAGDLEKEIRKLL